LIPKDKAKTIEDEAKLPYFVYLQGGPGFEVELQGSSGLAGEVHDKGYQSLWLDQRGTGLSTPMSPDLLTSLSTDAEKAKYLKNFRADSIGEVRWVMDKGPASSLPCRDHSEGL